MWQTELFVILDHFLLFYLSNKSENQNFEKMKKRPGDIILPVCTLNSDHMMHDYSEMVHNGQTDRQMDRQKKWHIQVGVPPKQFQIKFWFLTSKDVHYDIAIKSKLTRLDYKKESYSVKFLRK